MKNILHDALDSLNFKLEKNVIFLEIILCGAFAIELHGLKRKDQTEDIDTHLNLRTEVKSLIHEVATEFKLKKNWLNDQVSDIALPKGAESRFKEIQSWSNINAKLVSIEDLICMKASAWFSRGSTTTKDLEDLIILNPTLEQIEKGIQYTMESQKINELTGKFKTDAMDILNELKKILSK